MALILEVLKVGELEEFMTVTEYLGSVSLPPATAKEQPKAVLGKANTSIWIYSPSICVPSTLYETQEPKLKKKTRKQHKHLKSCNV